MNELHDPTLGYNIAALQPDILGYAVWAQHPDFAPLHLGRLWPTLHAARDWLDSLPVPGGCWKYTIVELLPVEGSS